MSGESRITNDSSLLPSLTICSPDDPSKDNDNLKKCGYCKQTVTSESHKCVKCEVFFHPSCAKKAGPNIDGSYKRCCGSRKNSPTREAPTLLVNDFIDALRNEVNPRLNKIDETLKRVEDTVRTIENRTTKNEKDMSTLRQDMKSSTDEVSAIETTNNNNVTRPMPADQIVADCIQELADRTSRKQNIIIFGLKELCTNNMT
uniref:Phorbol-ester/DAG-type domain-containing protein n=1 Tax=Bracon brevicornis TaxID=1563983 RepID=A0A6V7JU56_9HYME